VVNGIRKEYVYDAANRLIKEGDTTYRYDANGNRISAAWGEDNWLQYEYDAFNRLVAIHSSAMDEDTSQHLRSYGYDAEGNRLYEKRYYEQSSTGWERIKPIESEDKLPLWQRIRRIILELR
jgi:YD repeat-containing protein